MCGLLMVLQGIHAGESWTYMLCNVGQKLQKFLLSLVFGCFADFMPRKKPVLLGDFFLPTVLL